MDTHSSGTSCPICIYRIYLVGSRTLLSNIGKRFRFNGKQPLGHGTAANNLCFIIAFAK